MSSLKQATKKDISHGWIRFRSAIRATKNTTIPAVYATLQVWSRVQPAILWTVRKKLQKTAEKLHLKPLFINEGIKAAVLDATNPNNRTKAVPDVMHSCQKPVSRNPLRA